MLIRTFYHYKELGSLFVPCMLFQFLLFQSKKLNLQQYFFKKTLNSYMFQTLLVHRVLLNIIVNAKTVVVVGEAWKIISCSKIHTSWNISNKYRGMSSTRIVSGTLYTSSLHRKLVNCLLHYCLLQWNMPHTIFSSTDVSREHRQWLGCVLRHQLPLLPQPGFYGWFCRWRQYYCHLVGEFCSSDRSCV
jgi:hypothetical protein